MKSVLKLISTELFSKFIIMIVVSSSFNARFLTTFTSLLPLFFLHFLSATSLFGIVNIDCKKNTIIKLSKFSNWAFEKKDFNKITYIDYAVQSSLPYCLEQSEMVLTEMEKNSFWKCFSFVMRASYIGIVFFLSAYRHCIFFCKLPSYFFDRW